MSVNTRIFGLGDVSLNNRLFVATDLSVNKRIFGLGDASLNNRLFVAADVSANAKLFVRLDASFLSNTCLTVPNDLASNATLFVGSDASINGKLYAQRGAAIGLGSGLPIGSGATKVANTYALDISSGNTNFTTGNNPYPGAARIWEATGTFPTASGGTLVLQHGDVSGVSSIVFPSTTNFGNDYASIAYYESISGGILATTVGKNFNYNYYGDASSTSSSALVFNVQSNPYGNVQLQDSLILQPTGSCIIDACGSTVGQTIIQPRGGNVGIGKINPSQVLDVSGQINFSGKIVNNGLGVFSIAQNTTSSAVTNSETILSATTASTSNFFNGASFLAIYGTNAVMYNTGSGPQSISPSSFYSSNSGASWTSIATLPAQPFTFAMYGNNAIAVPTTSASTLSTYYSSNGGSTWTASNLSTIFNGASYLAMYGTNAVMFTTNNSSPTCYYSSNSGVTWTSISTLTAVAQPFTFAMYGNNVIAAPTATGSVTTTPYYSSNGGSTWTASNISNIFNTGVPTSLVMYGTNAIMSCAGNGSPVSYYSSNSGTTWTSFYITTLAQTFSFAMYGNNAIAIPSTSGFVYYSSNGGSTWTASNISAINGGSVSMYGNNAVMYIANAGSPVYYCSNNSGATWTSIPVLIASTKTYKLAIYGNNAIAVPTNGGPNLSATVYYLPFTTLTSSWNITNSYTINNQTLVLAMKVSGSKSPAGTMTYSLSYNNSSNVILNAIAYHNRANVSMPTTTFYVWNNAPVGTTITNWIVTTTGTTTVNDFLDLVLVALPI